MTQVTSGGRLVNHVSGQRRDTVWYELSRRTLDVIGSLLLLAFTLPLLLLVAFLIKVEFARTSALSTEPRRTAWPDIYNTEVPQHASRRRSRRSALGDRQRPAYDKDRCVHSHHSA